ncbi:MAG: cell filamentation protein Fic [Actinobacteria bacterium]|nr:cell filamentation protein Fic [Actinomycetota bacterium]
MNSSVLLTGDLPASTLHDRVRRGTLVRLASGIYAGPDDDLDAVVHRSWREIVAHKFPGAVVTDRSALWAGPHDGYLFIASARTGSLSLPGLTVVSRKGPADVDHDIAIGAGVKVASRPRALLDNTRLTRKRGDRPSATLARTELADWVDHLCAIESAASVESYRAKAETLAPLLGASYERVEVLNEIVGAALGTRTATFGSRAMAARSMGRPYDQRRLVRLELLADYLRDIVATHPALPLDAGHRRTLPFWEAYFSNFIEGTEFTPEEAAGIVFDGDIPRARPQDAHDVLATYQLVSNDAEMRRRSASADEFVEVLSDWHRIIMGGRPEMRPGEFKNHQHQAGGTTFVAPDLVRGTLERGYSLLNSLHTPTQRGTFVAFLVAEVHPFDDGNGRLARAVMNSEFVAGEEQRAIVPTISRNDYLRALRRLTRQDRPDLFVAMLDRVRRWTAKVDWTSLATATAHLEATNAFVDSNDAEDRGLHLLDP